MIKESKPRTELIDGEMSAEQEEIIKKDVFDGLYAAIEPMIAEGRYSEAQILIRKEMTSLAGVLLRRRWDDEQVQEKIRALSGEFENSFPEEARWFFNPETPEARAKAAKEHAAQIARAEAILQEADGDEEQDDEERHKKRNKAQMEEFPYKHCPWPIPSRTEMAPGLIVEIKNRLSGGTTTYEIFSSPESDEGESLEEYVLVKKIDKEGEAAGLEKSGLRKKYLVNMGIAPFYQRLEEGGPLVESWQESNYPVWWGSRNEYDARKNKK